METLEAADQKHQSPDRFPDAIGESDLEATGDLWHILGDRLIPLL